MRKLTREEWERKHPDFKTVDDRGRPWALRLDPETGATVLERVEIIEKGEEVADG